MVITYKMSLEQAIKILRQVERGQRALAAGDDEETREAARLGTLALVRERLSADGVVRTMDSLLDRQSHI